MLHPWALRAQFVATHPIQARSLHPLTAAATSARWCVAWPTQRLSADPRPWMQLMSAGPETRIARRRRQHRSPRPGPQQKTRQLMPWLGSAWCCVRKRRQLTFPCRGPPAGERREPTKSPCARETATPEARALTRTSPQDSRRSRKTTKCKQPAWKPAETPGSLCQLWAAIRNEARHRGQKWMHERGTQQQCCTPGQTQCNGDCAPFCIPQCHAKKTEGSGAEGLWKRKAIDLVVVSCAVPTGLHAGRALRRMWECGTGGSVRGSRLGRAKFIKNVDEKGIEPLTSRMLSGRSTPELHALR